MRERERERERSKRLDLYIYIYKLAKTMEMKTSDLNCVKYIKNENQRVSLRKMRLKKRWKIYFGKLIYETHTRYWSELSNPLEDRNRGLVIN